MKEIVTKVKNKSYLTAGELIVDYLLLHPHINHLITTLPRAERLYLRLLDTLRNEQQLEEVTSSDEVTTTEEEEEGTTTEEEEP